MSVPIIERVAVQTVLVPINPPHRTASGLVEKSPLVLIDLHCTGDRRSKRHVPEQRQAAEEQHQERKYSSCRRRPERSQIST